MISEKEVARVAHLARLSLSEEESKTLAAQLSTVLNHFEQVAKIDTTGVEPLVTPTDMEFIWREDKVETWPGAAEAAVENAPEAVGHLFKVPPVVG